MATINNLYPTDLPQILNQRNENNTILIRSTKGTFSKIYWKFFFLNYSSNSKLKGPVYCNMPEFWGGKNNTRKNK